MMKTPLVIALATSAMILTGLSAIADVVELKTGQRVEGRFKQATPASVSIEVGGQTITFTHDKVRAIYFGSAPSAAVQSSLRAEALRAVKGVQSAVAGSISYRDYTPRVTDAKIVVDRYLDEEKSDPDAIKAQITAAMEYYTLASKAWSEKISVDADVKNLALDPLTKDCPSAQAAIQEGRKSPFYAGVNAEVIGMEVGYGISKASAIDNLILVNSFSSFWSCASNKIAEADKVIGGK